MEQPAEVTAEDARKRFGELLNRVQWRGEHIVITRRGEPVAILSPLGEHADAIDRQGEGA